MKVLHIFRWRPSMNHNLFNENHHDHDLFPQLFTIGRIKMKACKHVKFFTYMQQCLKYNLENEKITIFYTL